MRGITFEAFSLAEPRARRPDAAEPRLFTEAGPRPLGDPAITEPGPLSEIAIGEGATAETHAEEPVTATSPRLATPGGRLAPAALSVSAGALFRLALVGLVASLTVGAFFGVGFLLLAGPEKKTMAAAEPISSHPSPPPSLEAGPAPHPAAAAAIPSPAPTPPQHQAESKSPPVPSIKPASDSPPPTSPASPARTVSAHPAPTAPPRPAAASIGPMDVSAGTAPPFSRHEAAAHAAVSRPTRVRRVAHAQLEPRHTHVRSHHLARSPALSPPRIAQSGTPSPAGQTRAFDQLLTQLTAPGEPTGRASPAPSLSPPPIGEPSPFAQDGGRR